MQRLPSGEPDEAQKCARQWRGVPEFGLRLGTSVQRDHPE